LGVGLRTPTEKILLRNRGGSQDPHRVVASLTKRRKKGKEKEEYKW
jgi:hypothetical protein